MSEPLIETLRKKVIGEVLYEDKTDAGLNDNITLNNSIVNYKKVEIEYYIAYGSYRIRKSEKVNIKNGNSVSLCCITRHSTSLTIFNVTRYKIQDNKITKEETEAEIRFSGADVSVNDNQAHIKITKVTGYK